MARLIGDQSDLQMHSLEVRHDKGMRKKDPLIESRESESVVVKK